MKFMRREKAPNRARGTTTGPGAGRPRPKSIDSTGQRSTTHFQASPRSIHPRPRLGRCCAGARWSRLGGGLGGLVPGTTPANPRIASGPETGVDWRLGRRHLPAQIANQRTDDGLVFCVSRLVPKPPTGRRGKSLPYWTNRPAHFNLSRGMSAACPHGTPLIKRRRP
jgi:hypothetical protein